MRSARSGSSLMAKIPRLVRGHEAVVQGELVGQVPALGHLDRVDLADEVGDRRVRGGQLLAEATAAVDPLDRGVVAVLGDEVLGVAGHRGVGVVVDLRAGHDRHPLVEQLHQRADHAGLRLAALAEEDHVVPGEERVLELREDRVLVAHDDGEQLLAGLDLGDGVAAQLLLHGDRGPSGGPELAEGGGRRVRRGIGRRGHGRQPIAGPEGACRRVRHGTTARQRPAFPPCACAGSSPSPPSCCS